MTVVSVLVSEMNTILSDRRSVWWHIGILLFLPVLLVLFWPADNLSFFLDRGRGPGTLSMFGTSVGIGLTLLSASFSFGIVPVKPGHNFVHWYRYTPAGPVTYLTGRLLFHLVHSLLLVFLTLPTMAVAAVPSRATPEELLGFAAFLIVSQFLFRTAAESGRRPDKVTGSLALLVFFILYIVYLITTYSSAPQWSYLSSLLTLSEPGQSSGSSIWKTLFFLFLVAAAGSCVALRRLFVACRIEKAGQSE